MPSIFDNVKFATYNPTYVGKPLDQFARTASALNDKYETNKSAYNAYMAQLSNIQVDPVNQAHVANRIKATEEALRDSLAKDEFENMTSQITDQMMKFTTDKAIKTSMEHYQAREATKEQLRKMYEDGKLSKTQYDDRIKRFSNYNGIGEADELGFYNKYSFDEGTKRFDVLKYLYDDVFSKYKGGDVTTTDDSYYEYLDARAQALGIPSKLKQSSVARQDGTEAIFMAKNAILNNPDALAYIEDEVRIHNENNPNNPITTSQYMQQYLDDVKRTYDTTQRTNSTKEIPFDARAYMDDGSGGKKKPNDDVETVEIYNTPEVDLTGANVNSKAMRPNTFMARVNQQLRDINIFTSNEKGNKWKKDHANWFDRYGNFQAGNAAYDSMTAEERSILRSQVLSFAPSNIRDKFLNKGWNSLSNAERDEALDSIDNGLAKFNKMKFSQTYTTVKPYATNYINSLFGGALNIEDLGANGVYANVGVHKLSTGETWNNGKDWLEDEKANLLEDGKGGKITQYLQSSWENVLGLKTSNKTFNNNVIVTINGEQYAFALPAKIQGEGGIAFDDDQKMTEIYQHAIAAAIGNPNQKGIIKVPNPMIKGDKKNYPKEATELTITTEMIENPNGEPFTKFTIYNPATNSVATGSSYTDVMFQLTEQQAEINPNLYRHYGLAQ